VGLFTFCLTYTDAVAGAGVETLMNTTQLFAEILVSGTGAVIAAGFLAAAVFRLPVTGLAAEAGTALLAPAIAVAYIFGIMIDRIGFGLFGRLEQRNRNAIVPADDLVSVEDKERFILLTSEALSLQLTYNRSRMRICRSWTINFLLIAIASGLWAMRVNLTPSLFLPALSLVLAVLSMFVWLKLSRDYYINVEKSYTYLKRHRA
jgi:hypothetical protein